LNKRLEEKSNLFKQKNDLHGEIKKIEQEKQEEIQNYNKNSNTEDQELINKEIEELKEKLMNASRTESRWINQRIGDLTKKQQNFQNDLAVYDEQIKRKLVKIEKIVEQYQSLNIKTTMIG